MKFKGRTWMSLFLAAISAGVVITALKWPFKTALFPVIIGTPVFLMALLDLLVNVSGGKDRATKHATFDFKLSEDVDPAVALRRTLVTFAWIIGFFLLILFLGFPIAVPLLVFSYLKFQGKEGWGISLGLTVLTWGFFYGLFVWLLHVPFSEGYLLRGMGLSLG
jgi:hypothetical protein